MTEENKEFWAGWLKFLFYVIGLGGGLAFIFFMIAMCAKITA